MATEKLEIEILAKGKPAEKAIKGVEKQTDKLGKTTKETGKTIDKSVDGMRESWAGLGAKIAAVTVALGASVAKAKEFERSAVGLTNAQKEWAKQTSLATDITAAQVAGFLKSAQTAGLSEQKMKDLAQQAIALGHAFPHEDAETLHDNLVMLNTTGEAQGFMVDILEQKLSSMGIAFEDMDLKALSTADKLKLIGEVAETSQKQLDDSPYTDLNTAMGTMSNTLTNLGDKLVKMGSDSGAFAVLTATVQVFAGVVELAATKLGDLVDYGKELLGLTQEQTELLKKEAEIRDKVNNNITTTDEKLANQNQLLKDVNKELKYYKSIGADKSIIDNLEKEKQRLEKVIQRHKERLTLAFTGKHGKLGEQTAAGGHIMTDALTNEEAERLAKSMKKTADATKEAKNEFNSLSNTGKVVTNNLTNAFTAFAMGTKVTFKDLAKSIIAQLVQIRVQAAFTKMFAGFSFHTGTSEVKHTGGAIGMAGIPSFHTGMRSDERLAKLQVGEAVINRGGATKNREAIEAMNKGYSVGGMNGQMTTAEINFNVQAIDAASFNSYLVNNRDTITGIINESLVSNGSVRRTIKTVI